MSLDDQTDHYEGALLEEINERLKGIQEGQDALVSVPADVAQLKLDMSEVKGSIKAINLAVEDQTKEINSLKGRDQPWV